MTEELEPVGFNTEEEVEKVVSAMELIRSYSPDLLNLQEFRHASAGIVSNLVMGILRGDYGQPANIKQAAEVANKVMDLVTKNELADLGNDLAKISDPEVRKATFEEIKARAEKAVADQKKDS